jgi:hypothetical protein
MCASPGVPPPPRARPTRGRFALGRIESRASKVNGQQDEYQQLHPLGRFSGFCDQACGKIVALPSAMSLKGFYFGTVFGSLRMCTTLPPAWNETSSISVRMG